jgi:hypothetical protein
MTWRLIDESVEFHRQHNMSRMRRLPSPIPELSSCIGEAVHLLFRIAAIPQRLWLAYLLRRQWRRVVLFADLGFKGIVLHDKHSSGCRMHESCTTPGYVEISRLCRRRPLEAVLSSYRAG